MANYIVDLKNKAKDHLSKYWRKALGVSAIYMVIALILGGATKHIKYDATIIENVILLFFGLGMTSFFFNVIKDKAEVKDIFSQGHIYIKGLILTLIQGSAGILLTILTFFMPDKTSNETVLALFGFSALILCILSIIIALMFALSTTILVDKPNISIMDALKESSRLMKGNKWKFIVLFLSFIGWFILAILTIGIGFLWLLPYVDMTLIEFYLDVKEKKKG